MAKTDLSEKEQEQMSVHKDVIEQRIRTIFEEMDKLVFQKYNVLLSGCTLPITFGFSKNPLAYYRYSISIGVKGRKRPRKEYFHFSLRYFAEEGDLALKGLNFRHIVIHEYAHYMAHHIFPDEVCKEKPHGMTWKKCCRELGIIPAATFNNKQRNYEYVQLFLLTGDYEEAPLAKAELSCGEQIIHPTLGKGRIIDIISSRQGIDLIIEFEGCTKTLDQKWVMKQCQLICSDNRTEGDPHII